MSRPPRTHIHGAYYHVTSRGNRRAPIFLDQRDFFIWLEKLAATAEKHHIRIYGYCLMPNHYHLLIGTPAANLSEALHMLNAQYCQHFNKRHGSSGHVIQGRFHAVLIKSNEQLLEVARYISLNPVRAGLTTSASDWEWSHHRHFLAPANSPIWLETDWMLSLFNTAESYEAFVHAGIGKPNPLKHYRQIPNPKREQARPLHEYQQAYPDRNEGMARAFHSTAYTLQEIAECFGVSTRTVSRALTKYPEV
ncbi:REP-associated tyrosine transposase [Pseudoduganella sp. OTU4001]|uniref:REP-associated tyrosine transposase n=1 Tax=Pseudoduganella sp. OTU4001 TaxID=3043854 RepID=UPI00313D0BF3